MINIQQSELDDVFHALADSTRRALLEKMSQGKSAISELAEPFDMSLTAISKHLKVLERAKLVTRQKKGRTYHCYLNAEAMVSASEWLAHYHQFWECRLDSLEDFLNSESEGVHHGKRKR